MKLLFRFLIGVTIFVGTMLVFDIPFPVLRESEPLGISASVLLYVVPVTLVSLLVGLLSIFGGYILIERAGACLGIFVALVINFFFSWVYLYNLPSWLEWYPAFTVGQSFWVVLIGSLMNILFIPRENKSS